MKPVIFEQCFGWVHLAKHDHSDHGVVLCSPFGYDAICIHRGWRKLAENLANAGLTTLRFDYPGTGDSAGLEFDPQRVEAWISSIQAAMMWMRKNQNVGRISLVGLGLGAFLGALAAQRSGLVDNLVLLAPVLDGRDYLRELRLYWRKWINSLNAAAVKKTAKSNTCVEVFGFGLHGADVEQLDALALLRDTHCPAQRILLLDSTPSATQDALIAHYRAHGATVTTERFDELDHYRTDAISSRTPVDAWMRVTHWLTTDHPNATEKLAALAAHPSSTALEEPYWPNSALYLDLGQAVEQPVSCGACFGIFCQPVHAKKDAIAVLILNTGANHHIGDARFSVLLARRLAALGIASLRVDLPGFGDASPLTESLTLQQLHSPETCQSAMTCVDWLVNQGHARVMAFGVCSGAYVAWQISVHHPKVAAMYGINMSMLVWDEETSQYQEHAPSADHFQTRLANAFCQVASRITAWSISGMTRLGQKIWQIRQILRGHYRMLYLVSNVVGRPVQFIWRSLAHEWRKRLQDSNALKKTNGLLSALHAKKTYVRLAYGEVDRGLKKAEILFDARLIKLKRSAYIQAIILPHIDHSLFTQAARETVMADLEHWLAERVMPLAHQPEEKQDSPFCPSGLDIK